MKVRTDVEAERWEISLKCSAGTQAFSRDPGEWTPWLVPMVEVLQEIIDKNFIGESDMDGLRWVPLEGMPPSVRFHIHEIFEQ